MQTFVCENLFGKSIDKRLFGCYIGFRTVVRKRMFGGEDMNNKGKRNSRSRRNRQLAFYKGIAVSVAAFVCIMVFVALFTNSWNVEASNGIEREKQYVSVEIEDGDTVWSVAEAYKTDDYNSTKDLVEEILEMNGLHENTVLKPGNKILVPNYVEVQMASGK